MASERLAALILAAGKGTRMKSEYPKVLHTICGLPLVEHIVRMLDTVRIRKKVVVVGYKQELIKRSLRRYALEYAHQKEQKGTAHAVQCAERHFKNFSGTVLVLAGDVPLVTAQTIRAFWREHRRKKAAVSVLTAALGQPKGYGRIVRDPAGAVVRIVEELDATREEKRITEVNSGIYLFEARTLFRLLRTIKINRKKKELYLTDTIEAAAARKIVAQAYCCADMNILRGVNSRRDLADLSTVMNRRNIATLEERGVTVMSPETTFIESDVRIGNDSIVYPCTYIESGVRIGSHCTIGPFCKIRKGTRARNGVALGSFVEINRSTIKEKTNIKHLAYIGDATVGPRANIGAGTITANYDGKHKHKTVIGEGVHIGSNTVLVAPVTVKKGARTGAGAVVRAHCHVPPYATAVGVPARIVKK